MKRLSIHISRNIAKDSRWTLSQKDEPLRDLSELDFVVATVNFMSKVAEPLLRSVYFERVKVWNTNTVAYYFSDGMHIVLNATSISIEQTQIASYVLPNTPYGRLTQTLFNKLAEDVDCLGGREKDLRHIEGEGLFLRYNGERGSVVLFTPNATMLEGSYDRAQPTSA